MAKRITTYGQDEQMNDFINDLMSGDPGQHPCEICGTWISDFLLDRICNSCARKKEDEDKPLGVAE